MKFYALSLAMLLQGSIAFAQNDPTVMTINGQPVSRSEFEYSFIKNNSEGVIDKKSVKEYVDLFVNYKLKVQPHMGWNKLELRSPSPLLEGAEGEYVYFVHSFHAEPEDRSIITSVCDYGMEVTASVGRGKVQAFQFHPEKSSRVGMRLLKNFVEL